MANGSPKGLMSKSARDYVANSFGSIKAAALLVDNPKIRVVSNFFVRFSKPVYPFRTFTNQNEAELWLGWMLD